MKKPTVVPEPPSTRAMHWCCAMLINLIEANCPEILSGEFTKPLSAFGVRFSFPKPVITGKQLLSGSVIYQRRGTSWLFSASLA